MKTLRAFWHWIDNDKPTLIRRDKLSPVAAVALCMAESQVASRALGDGSCWSTITLWELCSTGDGSNPNERPDFYRPKLVAAVRDLSLAICPALEAMHAAVPEAKPQTVLGMDFGKEPGEAVLFRREWIPPGMPTDTFRGVDRSKDDSDRLLSGPRVQTMLLARDENAYEMQPYPLPYQERAAMQLSRQQTKSRELQRIIAGGGCPDPGTPVNGQGGNGYEQRALGSCNTRYCHTTQQLEIYPHSNRGPTTRASQVTHCGNRPRPHCMRPHCMGGYLCGRDGRGSEQERDHHGNIHRRQHPSNQARDPYPG